MAKSSEGIVTHQIPNNRLQAKNLSSWTSVDVKLTVLMALMFVVGITWARQFSDGWAWGVGIGSVLLYTLMIIRTRAFYDRLYRYILSGMSGLIRVRLIQKGVLWQENDQSSWFVRLLRYGTLKKGVDSSVVWPFRPGLVEGVVGGKKFSYGLLRQKDLPFDHLVIRSSGAACVGEDPNRQTEFVNELAAILNKIAAISSLKVGLSMVRLTSPADMTPLKGYIATAVDPTIALTHLFELDEAQESVVDYLGQVMASTIPELQRYGATTNWYLIVVTIKRDSSSKRALSGKMSNRQIANMPVIRLGQSLSEALKRSPILQMHDAHCLGVAELSSLLRAGWDIASIHEHNEAKFRGDVPGDDENFIERIEGKNQTYPEVSQAFPQKVISVHQGESIPWYLRIDDNFIATLRFEQIPKDQSHVAQFLALHFETPLSVWTRMSEVGQSVSGEMESKLLYHQRSLLENFDRVVSGRNVLADPAKKLRRRRDAQTNEAIAAHSVAQHYHKLCSVVATSIEELEDAVHELKGVFESRGFNANLVPDPERQLDAFVTATYAINRM